jgi:excisionase family DNA binding protein
LKQHVHYAAKADDGAPLIGQNELTTSEAAALAECSMENIRKWIRKHRIGYWNSRLRMFVVSRERLEARMRRRKKSVGPSQLPSR